MGFFTKPAPKLTGPAGCKAVLAAVKQAGHYYPASRPLNGKLGLRLSNLATWAANVGQNKPTDWWQAEDGFIAKGLGVPIDRVPRMLERAVEAGLIEVRKHGRVQEIRLSADAVIELLKGAKS